MGEMPFPGPEHALESILGVRVVVGDGWLVGDGAGGEIRPTT